MASIEAEPEQKVLTLIYTHLSVIKEVVTRNGSLRAEFFRNIWLVEKVRRQFDEEERNILRRVLEEGIARAKFRIDNVNLMADIIHYSVKGLEVPYIYDRLGEGLTDGKTQHAATRCASPRDGHRQTCLGDEPADISNTNINTILIWDF